MMLEKQGDPGVPQELGIPPHPSVQHHEPPWSLLSSPREDAEPLKQLPEKGWGSQTFLTGPQDVSDP